MDVVNEVTALMKTNKEEKLKDLCLTWLILIKGLIQ